VFEKQVGWDEEVLVKTALISIWTKLFVPIGFFTDSLLVINTCSSPGLSKWGEKGKKRKFSSPSGKMQFRSGVFDYFKSSFVNQLSDLPCSLHSFVEKHCRKIHLPHISFVQKDPFTTYFFYLRTRLM
jgi:hypothetical protein